MFIQTEITPNPETLKFLPGREISPDSPRDFATPEEAHASRLARELFGVEGVTGVFAGADFVTVTKAEGVDWIHIRPSILGAISDAIESGEPLFDGDKAGRPDHAISDDPIVKEIVEILDTRVRPAVAQDGGDITFHSYDEASGMVRLHMRGACAGCPSSTMTLKMGIENLLKHYLPEVKGVEAVT